MTNRHVMRHMGDIESILRPLLPFHYTDVDSEGQLIICTGLKLRKDGYVFEGAVASSYEMVSRNEYNRVLQYAEELGKKNTSLLLEMLDHSNQISELENKISGLEDKRLEDEGGG